MKAVLVLIIVILFLSLLGVFQSGADQIDYSDPEVMKAWEEVYIGVEEEFYTTQDTLTRTEVDSMPVKSE